MRNDALERIQLLVDNDTGIDDALALAYLCACDHVGIVTVTSTPGNVNGDQVAANYRALLKHCGKQESPVLIGARNPLANPLVIPEEIHGFQDVGCATLAATGAREGEDQDAVGLGNNAAREPR